MGLKNADREFSRREEIHNKFMAWDATFKASKH
jgi:hypothetical protein